MAIEKFMDGLWMIILDTDKKGELNISFHHVDQYNVKAHNTKPITKAG